MSYRHYRVEGLILAGKNFGEADRLLSLLTADFGLVKAAARGVRQLKSKLRYHLQDFSHGYFSLVRGVEFWRVTGAAASGLTASLLREENKGRLLARLCRLLGRLLPEEGELRPLFYDLKDGLRCLSSTVLDVSQLRHFELLFVGKLLYRLGYLDLRSEFRDLTETNSGRLAFLDCSSRKKTVLVQMINRALRHSHL